MNYPLEDQEKNIEFLNQFKELNPGYEGLAQKLLAIGGEQVLFTYNPYFEMIKAEGKPYDCPIQKKTIAGANRCKCFSNSGNYFCNNGRTRIAAGFALMKDKWHSHYWIILDGEIIEITPEVEFSKYFGITLPFKESVAFCIRNYVFKDCRVLVFPQGKTDKVELITNNNKTI